MLRKFAAIAVMTVLTACGGTAGKQIAEDIGAGIVVTQAPDGVLRTYSANPQNLTVLREQSNVQGVVINETYLPNVTLSPDAIGRYALLHRGLVSGEFVLNVYNLRDGELIGEFDRELLEEELFEQVNKGIAYNERTKLKTVRLKDAWWVSPSLFVAKIYAQAEDTEVRQSDYVMAFSVHELDGGDLEIISQELVPFGDALPEGFEPRIQKRLADDRLEVTDKGALLIDGKPATGLVLPVAKATGILFLD